MQITSARFDERMLAQVEILAGIEQRTFSDMLRMLLKIGMEAYYDRKRMLTVPVHAPDSEHP